MYTTNSLWDCFAESIFNAKVIKSPAPNNTQDTFPTCSSLGFAKDGQCRGHVWVEVAVRQVRLP